MTSENKRDRLHCILHLARIATSIYASQSRQEAASRLLMEVEALKPMNALENDWCSDAVEIIGPGAASL